MNEFINRLEDKILNPVSDLSTLSAEEQFQTLKARASTMNNSIIPANGLLEKLQESKRTNVPLRVKFGIDPTGSEIHLGHAISLINLRMLQRMGHKIILVIGDFTATIGDPSGRVEDRPSLTKEDVQRNMATYQEQASKIIDLSDSSVEKHYNSEWMDNIKLSDWLSIIKKISVNSLMQRDDFRNRIAAGSSLSIAEMEYALFMGYDSVKLQPDLELGGIDQYLNLNFCRDLMSNAGQKPEVFITYDLLPGTTGEKDSNGRYVKMSKSKHNYIPIMSSPEDMYGKVMSIPDDVMWIWYKALVEITPSELNLLQKSVESGTVHPKEAKQLLARSVVAIFNHFDKNIVKEAEKHFDERFGKNAKVIPSDIRDVQYARDDLKLVDVLREETRRTGNALRALASQGGLKQLNEDGIISVVSVDDLMRPISNFRDRNLRVGKKDFLRIIQDRTRE